MLHIAAVMRNTARPQCHSESCVCNPDAIGYANFYSRSHDAVIRVYNDAGNVIETPEQGGDFKEP